jgi:hypothetical protein
MSLQTGSTALHKILFVNVSLRCHCASFRKYIAYIEIWQSLLKNKIKLTPECNSSISSHPTASDNILSAGRSKCWATFRVRIDVTVKKNLCPRILKSEGGHTVCWPIFDQTKSIWNLWWTKWLAISFLWVFCVSFVNYITKMIHIQIPSSVIDDIQSTNRQKH